MGRRKGYVMPETHKLRIRRTLHKKSIERLDSNYVTRRKELVAGLAEIEDALLRAEAIEKAEKNAASVGVAS